MLAEAIADIDRAVATAERERRRRLEERAALRRAEEYLWAVEDMLEEGHEAVPEPLLKEMGRFVRPYSRRLARTITRASNGAPGPVLDALFDVQERIQRSLAGPVVAAEGAPA